MYATDARAETDSARQGLREIVMASSQAWRDAGDSRPTSGFFVNPYSHIYRKVKVLVPLLAADRANAIHGVGGGWTKGHVDRRLRAAVDTILPALIAEASPGQQETLNSWLVAAQEIIDMAE